MIKKEKYRIEKELKKHILDCQQTLLSLESNLMTIKQELELDNMLELIRDKQINTLSTIDDEKKFIKLINNIPSVAIQGYNKNREVIYWNSASEIVYGYTSEEALGKRLEDLIAPAQNKEIMVSMITQWYEDGKKVPEGEVFLVDKNNHPVHVYSSHVMLGKGTNNPEIFCVDIDLKEISSLKIENKVLERKAHFDKLTDIYNRHYFERVIENKFIRAKEHNTSLSIIMFDIDHFKQINDTHGHDIGDKSLIALIEIVKEIISDEHTIVRWGGDEFIILLDLDFIQTHILTNKLNEHVKIRTSELDDIPYFTCSFGITDMLNFSDFEQAYKAVDEKLYHAKKNGRNRVES